MTERETREKTLEAKESQLAEMFSEYYGRIAGYAYTRTGDRALAEDIASEVFLRALKALPSYCEKGPPMGAWLFRIAHNLVVDHHRKRSRHLELPGLEDRQAYDEDLVAQIEKQHELDRVMIALKNLSPAQQEVIQLRFAGGLSSREVALVMGKSDGAVREMQREALSRIRTMLAGEGKRNDR